MKQIRTGSPYTPMHFTHTHNVLGYVHAYVRDEISNKQISYMHMR